MNRLRRENLYDAYNLKVLRDRTHSLYVVELPDGRTFSYTYEEFMMELRKLKLFAMSPMRQITDSNGMCGTNYWVFPAYGLSLSRVQEIMGGTYFKLRLLGTLELIKPGCAVYPGTIIESPVVIVKKGSRILVKQSWSIAH